MEKWYKRSLWRNLVDMHIPDWNPSFMSRFDPELYAALMDEAKTDACELYAGNCLGICFFPTKAGHMHKGLMGRDQVGETLAELHDATPLGRSGTPADVARAMVWLADAEFVTGQVLAVNGGFVII